MATWVFEEGHTEAAFKARHMMVTWVRGLFKNIAGTLEFDPDKPETLGLKTKIEAASLWTGVPARDDHLRSSDFFHVKKYKYITFKSTKSRRVGASDYVVMGELTIRGVTKKVDLHVSYLGEWPTSYWVGDTDHGPIPRLGFTGSLTINRRDFGVSWNGDLPDKGVVVSDAVEIAFEIEALPKKEIDRITKRAG